MNNLLLPAGIIGASLAMTYFCCIRPMRKGRCAMQGSQNAADTSADTVLDLALRQARADLEKIRSEIPNDGDPVVRSSTANEPSTRGADPLPDPLTAPTER